jgi:hypothetical protein
LDEINRDVIDHIGTAKKQEASASTANRLFGAAAHRVADGAG